MIFSPSRITSFFNSHCGLFAKILPYFAFNLPFYFPFSHFLSPLFLFLSPFTFFHLVFPSFPLFLFTFLYFFPQMTSADIFLPPKGGGGGICQYIDPCTPEKLQVKEVDKTFRLIRGSSHNTGGAES
jgi:hypothetical protein